MKITHFIGIDVSKKTFDVAIKTVENSYLHAEYSNDQKGIKSFLKTLKEEGFTFSECLVCLEHTGVYTHKILQILHERGLNIWLERALSIKRSLGLRRGKNDKVDSERIAEYAFRYNDKCVLWKPSRKEVNRLQNLISLRLRLIKAKKLIQAPVAELVDIKHADLKESKRLSEPVLKKIKDQIVSVEKEIEELINSDTHLQRLQQIITSVEGVGKVTAWSMIVHTNEFKDFHSSRQFACHSGIVPFDHSSGTSIRYKPRVSHMANKRMKELLHMSALSATVMKGELNDYYNRKVKEGKNKMLVLNNIRNKLVHRIFTCVNENRLYDKTYTHTLA